MWLPGWFHFLIGSNIYQPSHWWIGLFIFKEEIYIYYIFWILFVSLIRKLLLVVEDLSWTKARVFVCYLGQKWFYNIFSGLGYGFGLIESSHTDNLVLDGNNWSKVGQCLFHFCHISLEQSYCCISTNTWVHKEKYKVETDASMKLFVLYVISC